MQLSEADRRLGLIAGLFVAALVLWPTPLLFPVKVLVVFAHELSHGLAAVLTGGSIDRIELSPALGGVCYTRGGWRVVILSAGYLGSCAFGGALLWSASRTRFDREISRALGAALLVVTVVWVRSLFGFASGLLFGGLLLASGTRLPERFNDALLSFIGLTSMMYAIIDIKEDLLVRTVPCSDAYQLSLILPLPPALWGLIWAGLSVGMLAAVVRRSSA